MAILSEVEDVLRSLRDVWDEDAVDELVLASALHDLGHSPLFGDDWKQHHDTMARTWLTPRFGARVGGVAGAHVAAKVAGERAVHRSRTRRGGTRAAS